ncbi:MAG: hypothetical protein WBA97_09980 [Actinophytocola sp.]|uniref:hypothetical protein n=1 Tax=Actinophytocola sp. TaxID=1872138 RepID=UPI003C762F4D
MTYPQQGGYGAPQGSGYPPPPPQNGGYGYPPPGPGGYGQYPPPRKDNTGLIIGVAGAVVVAVVALVLVLVLTGDDDSPSRAGDGTSEDSGLPGGIPGPNGPGGGDFGGSSDSDSDSDSDSGGGSSGGGAATPEDLADIVVEVIETQDEDLIDEHACSSSAADQLKTELTRIEGMDVSATVEDVQESGDIAQASIEISLGGEKESFTAEMEKDGDIWCASGI